jgi:hypothetical protein
MSNERISSGKKPAAAPSGQPDDAPACSVPAPPGHSGVTVASFQPRPPVPDYLRAMSLANTEAAARPPDCMLLSRYDRDFEAPQHASGCHAASAVPGYVDGGIHHGATLKVDAEDGRFEGFHRPVDL